MNPLLKHFFFSTLKRQTEKEVKKAGKDYGSLQTISFIADKTKVIQRVKFEKYEGDSTLDDQDKEKLAKLLNIDFAKEQASCKQFFAVLDFKEKTIRAKKILNSGESQLINV